MTKQQYHKRTVVKESINSIYLKEERAIRIFLPPEYSEKRQYPVVYTQDGQDAFMFGRMATISNQLILEEKCTPFILVGVDVDKRERSAEYAIKGEKHKRYLDFFHFELIPFIEQRYSALQQERARVLVGDSLGATVALHLAIQYPTISHKVISYSGAFFDDVEELVRNSASLVPLQIWMLVGLEEISVKTHLGTLDFVAANRKVKNLLEAKNVQVIYKEEHGEHKWGFWQKYIEESFIYFLKP